MSAPSAKAGLELHRWQRPLLPGGMVDGQSGRRTARDWAIDAAMTMLALGIGALVLTQTWIEHSTVEAVLDIALGLLACGALWFRREHPVGVAALVLAISFLSALAGGALLAVVFNSAIRCDRRALGWIALAALANTLVFPLIYPGSDSYLQNVLFGTLLVGIAIGWGLFARARRDLVASLHQRGEQLEAEAALRDERAREGERRRIAREMHDVLAHRLSLLSLHAGALEFRPDAPPEEVAEAAAVVRRSARAALEELRDVVGVLREGSESGTEPPQPTLRDLPALIGEARAAGMRVEAEIEVGSGDDGGGEDGGDAGAVGEWAGGGGLVVGERAGRTAYRIVQEGLTNARKHSPNALVTVRVVATAADALEVEVSNPEPVGAAVAGAADLPGAGSGLIGLGERVALIGGELSHVHAADGAYHLRATLPAAE